MNIIYAKQSIPKDLNNSVFLAGPTPRSPEVKSWRPEAINIFRQLNFSGTLLIPEDLDGSVKGNYDDQIEWEEEGLTRASAIMFWLPRNLKTLPGLTTNVEFGVWMNSGRWFWEFRPKLKSVSIKFIMLRNCKCLLLTLWKKQ